MFFGFKKLLKSRTKPLPWIVPTQSICANLRCVKGAFSAYAKDFPSEISHFVGIPESRDRENGPSYKSIRKANSARSKHKASNQQQRTIQSKYPQSFRDKVCHFLGYASAIVPRYMKAWSTSGKSCFLPSIPLAKDRKHGRRDPKETLTDQSFVVARSSPIRFFGRRMRGSHYQTVTLHGTTNNGRCSKSAEFLEQQPPNCGCFGSDGSIKLLKRTSRC